MIYQQKITTEAWECYRDKRINNVLKNPEYEYKVWKLVDNELYKICPMCKKWIIYDIKYYKKRFTWIDAKHTMKEYRLGSRCRKCDNIYKNKISKTSTYLKFILYKNGAYKRNLCFDLSEERCEELFNQPCYYCGYISRTLNGIDRVNSDIGYSEDNVVACCKACNMMKGALEKKMAEKWNVDFIEHCVNIANYQKKMKEKGIISS